MAVSDDNTPDDGKSFSVTLKDICLSNSWALQAILDYLEEETPGTRERIWQKYIELKRLSEQVETDPSAGRRKRVKIEGLLCLPNQSEAFTIDSSDCACDLFGDILSEINQFVGNYFEGVQISMIKVAIRNDNDINILDIDGGVDLDGVDILKEEISRQRQNGCRKIVLNMEKVSNISSTILNRLQSSITAFWAPGGRIAVANISTGNLRILEKSQFIKMLIVATSEEDAIKQLERL